MCLDIQQPATGLCRVTGGTLANPARTVRSVDRGTPEPIAAAGTIGRFADHRPTGRPLGVCHSSRKIPIFGGQICEDPKPLAALISSHPAGSSRSRTIPPDGTQDRFHFREIGRNEVWTADADGSNAVQVTTQGPFQPRLAGRRTDGSIAFAQAGRAAISTYIVDAQGGTPRRMTTEAGQRCQRLLVP